MPWDLTCSTRADFMCRLALPEPVKHWLLTALREKPFDAAHGPESAEGLVKIGARVIRHARYIVVQMAKVAVPREVFGAIPGPIRRLGPMPT